MRIGEKTKRGYRKYKKKGMSLLSISNKKIAENTSAPSHHIIP